MSADPQSTTRVDVVIPCYNEEAVVRESVERVRAFLADYPRYEWRIVTADNGSTDRTPEIARELEREHPGKVEALLLKIKGRGLPLRHAWLGSNADVVSYMDVDRRTDLEHLQQLIDMIVVDGCDVAVGSRLARGSKTKRGLKREITSRGYVFMILATFPRMRLTDAQCGFKAMSRKAVQEIIPLVENRMWFFDTELLILAHRLGLKSCELPVRWVEDPDTKVKIISTAIEDIKGLARMRFRRLPARRQA
jgi:glycosyltransferase involved in cell wall biosynthesis